MKPSPLQLMKVTEEAGHRDGQVSPYGKKRIRAVLVAVLVALGSLASAGTAAGTDSGKETVALTPFSANAMALMGVFPAAVGQTIGGESRLVSGLRTTPVLQLQPPLGPDEEELAVFEPKLIFTSPWKWRMGEPMMQDMVKKKQGRVVAADPTSVQGVYAKTRQIASIFDRRSRGKRLIRTMKRQIAAARRGIRSADRPRVMVILGLGFNPQVFLENSWGGRLVRLAGGRLLTAGEKSGSGWAALQDEAVVDEKPDVIIGVPHAPTRTDSEIENYEKIVAFFKSNPAWASTPAVKNGRVFISEDNRLLQAGTDIGQTIRIIRKQYLKNG